MKIVTTWRRGSVATGDVIRGLRDYKRRLFSYSLILLFSLCCGGEAAAAKLCRPPCNTDLLSAGLANNTTCLGGFRKPVWTLVFSCNQSCGQGAVLHAGKIYRFDIRNSTKAANFLVTRTTDTFVYSFQQNCNRIDDNPCVGMIGCTIDSYKAGTCSYDTNNHWFSINTGLSVPGITAAEIMEAQPAGSLRVYVLSAEYL